MKKIDIYRVWDFADAQGVICSFKRQVGTTNELGERVMDGSTVTVIVRIVLQIKVLSLRRILRRSEPKVMENNIKVNVRTLGTPTSRSSSGA